MRDVYRVGGTLLAAAALGVKGDQAFLHEHTVYLIAPDGGIEAVEADIKGETERRKSQAECRLASNICGLGEASAPFACWPGRCLAQTRIRAAWRPERTIPTSKLTGRRCRNRVACLRC